MGWKKPLAIVAIVLAVLVVGAGIGIYVLSRPATLVPYHDAVSPELRDQQSRMTLALRFAGIQNAVVTVAKGTAAAAYDVPTNGTTTADDWQRTVLSTLAPLAPETTTLVATQFVNEKPAVQWSVPTAKMLAFQAKQLSAADLEATVTKKSA